MPDERLVPPEELGKEIAVRYVELPEHRATLIRRLRREYSRRLYKAPGRYLIDVVQAMRQSGWPAGRALPYELLRFHRGAMALMDDDTVETLGEGIDSWGSTDCFARLLAGPAWVQSRVSDGRIARWTGYDNLWWRRAALGATVALNVKASGGWGDTLRTLSVCRALVHDREVMVAKALSWALRALAPHDPEAVRFFLAEYDDCLAAQLKREVRSKLETGFKYPSGAQRVQARHQRSA